ncbi:MAG TPA: serine/threonine-protein kinase [Streptosporangiaceae bacterium]|jgi:serine/threonine protein kinase|nr:serine/threonine-protein kinase [Streptosporangiaceae bacterium]
MQPLTDADPGEIAGYRIGGRLGTGGMGRVYLAFTEGGRPVALKVIRPELGDDPEFRHRFRQEVAAARRVHGLYTAQVLDANPDATPPWLVTAYVPGPSLQETVTSHGPMPPGTVLLLMAGVAEALRAIHAAGVVHRDLKPSNVLLAPDGPRVIDFGIAWAAEATTVTRTGIRVGSPQFMAPEQISGRAVAPAIDVFSLGSLAAFAATGRPAFGQGSMEAVLYRVLHEPADLRDCPPPLRGLVERCLAKQPTDRPAVAAVVTEARRLAAGQGLQVSQSWLPAAVAAALSRHAPPPPPMPAAAAPPPPPQRPQAPPPPRPAVQQPVPAQPDPPQPVLRQPAPPQPAPHPAAPHQNVPYQPGPYQAPPQQAPPQQGAPHPGWAAAQARPQGPPPAAPYPQPRPSAPYPGSPYGGQPGSTAPLPPAPPTDPRGGRPPGPRTGTIIAIIAAVLVLALVGAILLDNNLHAKNRNAGPTLSPAPAIHTHNGSTSSSSSPVTSGQPWYTGVWTGSADQPTGLITTWTVDVSFVSTGKTGVFVIPTLDCSGLLLITSSGPNSLSVNEVVVKNSKDLCAPDGHMTLTRSGLSGMDMSWQDSAHPDNTATGTLLRLRS